MPTPGETWQISDPYGRSTRGIIAEVTDTRVTLVSLTGARSHVPVSRFEGWWTFVAAPPKTNLRCSRCKDSGILTFQRGVSPEFVCPRHLPVGILASLHTAGEVAERVETAPRNLIQCPDCGNPDPVEDARLGVLGRGEFGWWTCPRCSTRWGLISPPNDTDNPGRWYLDTLAELTETMLETGEVHRIECSRTAWNALVTQRDTYGLTIKDEVVPDSGFPAAEFQGIPIHLLVPVTEGSVLVRAKIAPAGATISRRPIQKLGGIGGRSVAAPAATPVTPILETMLGVLGVLGADAGPLGLALSGVRTVSDLIDAVPDNGRFHSDGIIRPSTITFTKPTVVLPSVGSMYIERRSGKEVEVMRVEESEGRWAVAMRDKSFTTMGSAPRIMGINDFNAEFVKSNRPVTDPPPPPVAPVGLDVEVGQEWFSFTFDEYATVVSVNLVKLTAVVKGASSGRTRNELLQNFTDANLYKKVVRLTAHQRLMAEDDT